MKEKRTGYRRVIVALLFFATTINYLDNIISDATKTAGNITAGYNILIIICGYAYPLARFLMHLLTPKMEPAHVKRIAMCLAFALWAKGSFAQRVVLDHYFNHEVHKTAPGTIERFHYLWDEKANTGFSIWGDTFKALGATLDTLGEAATAHNLSNADVYIIVDPDSKKENLHPNYIDQQDADNIANWVKQGGVLVLMANDSANVDLQHFNILAAEFGLHFNNDLQNHVVDDAHFADGTIITGDNPIFAVGRKVFLKDVCSISGKAKPVLTSASGSPIAVMLKYGKGTVFAIGDPWLYNEYVNGRLPAGYENDKAAAEFSKWLVEMVKKE